MKVKMLGILIFVFVLGSAVGAKAESYLEAIDAYWDHGIKMVMFGKDFVAKDANGKVLAPIHYQGSTYIPIRAVAEAVGLPVKWDPETRTASVGFDKIQLNNYSETSFVDIQVDGSWRPSYITPVKKQYSNSFMGVIFEIRSTGGSTTEEIVEEEKKKLKELGVPKMLSTSTIEQERFTAEVMEYRTYYSGGEPEAHNNLAIIPSHNSDEYYIIHVYITDEKYDEHKGVFDDIVSSFRKQR
jgi:hypothetical protein